MLNWFNSVERWKRKLAQTKKRVRANVKINKIKGKIALEEAKEFVSQRELASILEQTNSIRYAAQAAYQVVAAREASRRNKIAARNRQRTAKYRQGLGNMLGLGGD